MTSYTFDNVIKRDVQDALRPEIDRIISKEVEAAKTKMANEMKKVLARIAVRVAVEEDHYNQQHRVVVELRLPDEIDD